MPNTSLREAAPTAYLGFAQLYQRLRPKRRYAAGFTTTPLGFALLFLGCALSVAMPQALRLPRGQARAKLRTSSAQVAQYKCSMPKLKNHPQKLATIQWCKRYI
ncbi:MAG: hypothetical protein V7L20_25190 [Nostoc sp.]|uniref:hypothetical protein n=1 Tax=Nostoc sp. TaxID=1180 RepID=UPI002FFAFD5A